MTDAEPNEWTDEEIMAAFTAEVTAADPIVREDDDLRLGELEIHWEPLFFGWCAGKGIPLARAFAVHPTFRYDHQYNYIDTADPGNR